MPAFPYGLLNALSTRMAGCLVTDRDTGQVRTWFHVERQAVGAFCLVRRGYRYRASTGHSR